MTTLEMMNLTAMSDRVNSDIVARNRSKDSNIRASNNERLENIRIAYHNV